MGLDHAQLSLIAQEAGLSGSRASVAAQIALAESGGDSSKHNDNPATGDDSWGLWQINLYKTLGPPRRKHLGLAADGSEDSKLTNPLLNAQAMAWISDKGGNFSPWTTYTNGKYKDQSDGTGLPGVISPGVDGAVKTVAGSVGDILEYIGKTALWIGNPHNWIRVVYVVGGVAVVGIGLAMVIKDSGAGKVAGKAVGTFTPAGRATKAVRMARVSTAQSNASTAASRAAKAAKGA